MTRTTSLFPVLVSVVLVSVIVNGERPRYGGTIRIETQAKIRSLDPAAVAADSSDASIREAVLPLLFETLVSVDPGGGIRPGLATSWATDASAMRWQFPLRRGVRLHDGTILEASHVVSALQPHLAAQVAADGSGVVIDTGGRPDLLWELADPRRGIVVRSAAGALIGTGPFQIERLESARLLLRAHDGYWGSRPFLDGVRIDFDRALAGQLTNLETGRADLVAVRPTDVRRLTQRQLRVSGSRPIELFALVFEPHRAIPVELSLRRTLSAAIDRDQVVRVLLQGHGEPARTVLPTWLSGYPSFVAEERRRVGPPERADEPALAGRVAQRRDGPGDRDEQGQRFSRAAIAGLPAARRSMILRVTAGDTVAQAVADRVAVDAREAGFLMTVQVPTGLAPRADLRLVRLTLAATSPERSLATLMAALGPRTLLSVTREPAPLPGASLEAVARVERALLESHVIVPLVHMPALYASDRVESFEGPVVFSTGGWNLANVWLQPAGNRP